MAKLYLLDSCVWRDFYEYRFSKSGKPLGKYATRAFMKIIKDKSKILFSEALIRELKRDYPENDVNGMLQLLIASKIAVRIDITRQEYLEAGKLSHERSIPFVDCLNAVQSRNHKAIMVTQDKHFFRNLSDIIKPVRPQEV